MPDHGAPGVDQARRAGDAEGRRLRVGGTVVDVVYLGSMTQLIVLLRDRRAPHGASAERRGRRRRARGRATGHAALGRRAQLRRRLRGPPTTAAPTAERRRRRGRGHHGDRDRHRSCGRADRRRLEALHALRLAGPVEGRAARDRPRRRRVHVRRRRPALARLQLAADGREHRPRRQAGHGSDRAAGREARRTSRRSRRSRAARVLGKRLAESVARRHREDVLHPRRRRGERERGEDREAGHGAAEGPGALPQLPRLDVRRR